MLRQSAPSRSRTASWSRATPSPPRAYPWSSPSAFWSRLPPIAAVDGRTQFASGDEYRRPGSAVRLGSRRGLDRRRLGDARRAPGARPPRRRGHAHDARLGRGGTVGARSCASAWRSATLAYARRRFGSILGRAPTVVAPAWPHRCHTLGVRPVRHDSLRRPRVIWCPRLRGRHASCRPRVRLRPHLASAVVPGHPRTPRSVVPTRAGPRLGVDDDRLRRPSRRRGHAAGLSCRGDRLPSTPTSPHASRRPLRGDPPLARCRGPLPARPGSRRCARAPTALPTDTPTTLPTRT